MGAALGAGLLGNPAATADAAANAALVYHVNGVAVRHYRPLVPNTCPSIIMVHGGAHAGWVWERYAPYLAGHGWDCHALDWYNHGLSSSLPVQQFITRSIRDVRTEIGHVCSRLARPYILMGHSMGGLAALYSAQTFAARALVLITPVVPAEVGAQIIPIPVDMTRPYPVPPFSVAKSMFFSTMSDTEAMLYYVRLQQESPVAVWEATRWTVSVNLSAITMPVLTVAAGADTLTPPSAVRELAGMLNGTNIDVPGMGHSDVLLKQQGWLPVAQDVEDWLLDNT
jgi:pimeloyl-ACP methyl ester carboxylesterase